MRTGESVLLTAREFALLQFLLRHADRVVTETEIEIVEHVWDANSDGDHNIVEVYVGYLRRKIDRPFSRDTIETLRGAGCRLRADGA